MLGADGEGVVRLIDSGVYVEDGTGGYWTLASGDPVLDSDGAPIARATLEDVLAMGTTGGEFWQLEQAWSPSSRGEAVQFREEAPYLLQLIDGRAVIDDYGIQNPDGSWRLASGRDITDGTGAIIAAPTVADILALDRNPGQEWRVENIDFNPYADVPVDVIGVRFTDGLVVDYTVELTDQDGTFHVWARNLDRALELQFKTGDSREFNLRNFAVDLATLDEVNSTDDSSFRVELLTPGQFHFATSVVGVEFQPEMLTATLDNSTGIIDYKGFEGGGISLSTTEYVSVIEPMIEIVKQTMSQYVLMSRRLAARLALQGGFPILRESIEYDVEQDVWRPTTDRELAPMFEAIFAGAPDSNADDAVYDYFEQWHAILRRSTLITNPQTGNFCSTECPI